MADCNPTPIPTAAPRPAADRPWLPVALFGLIVAASLTIILLPPWLRERRLRQGERPNPPTWRGETYQARCRIIVRLVHPEGENGRKLAESVGDDNAVLIVVADNAPPGRPVAIDLREARLYEFIGRPIAARPAAGNELGPLTVAPGQTASAVLFFPKDQVLAAFDRLYALQFKLDGEYYNLAGNSSTTQPDDIALQDQPAAGAGNSPAAATPVSASATILQH